ncbi:hypothetical protein GX586_03700 [bacterium]|nr:hypothetical protein [bacterium]
MNRNRYQCLPRLAPKGGSLRHGCRLIRGLLTAALVCAAHSAPAAPPAVTNAPPVFIAAFSDETGGRVGEGMAEAVRDLLLASLATRPGMRLVDRDDLERVLSELTLTLSGLTDPARGVQVGRLLGAQRLVTGSILPGEEGVALVAHVLDVETGVVQTSCKAEGPASEVPERASELADRIAEALKLPFDPGTAVRLERAPLASLHYLRGLGSFHAGDYDRAIMEFAVSDELGVDNPALHAWSGRAYEALEEPEHAVVDFRRYLELAPDGPETEEIRQRLARCEARLKERPAADAARAAGDTEEGSVP